MKFISLLLVLSISALTNGQNKDFLTNLKPVDADFLYLIDSLEFKGTRWICTQPVRTIFTKVIYNEKANILSVKGYFMLAGDVSDTAKFGIGGASIFLLNVSKDGKINRVFDLGETSDEFHSNYLDIFAGHFARKFSLTKGDILLIGGCGIFGATAFQVGELLNTKN